MGTDQWRYFRLSDQFVNVHISRGHRSSRSGNGSGRWCHPTVDAWPIAVSSQQLLKLTCAYGTGIRTATHTDAIQLIQSI